MMMSRGDSMQEIDKCIESYRRLKNLKLVGAEVGVPWQTVYVMLRAAGAASEEAYQMAIKISNWFSNEAKL